MSQGQDPLRSVKRKRGSVVVQDVNFSERVQQFSNEQLSDIICRCESAIADGSAEIEDYEAFVLAQQELARRTWA